MGAKPNQSNYLNALTGLRGLAAIYIFMFHYGTYNCSDIANRFSNNGRVAVSLFFVLSGFIMVHTHGHCEMDNSKPCRKMFWIKRWFRLMPAYLVSLAVNLNDVRCIWNDDYEFPETGEKACSNWKWFDIFMQLFGISTWLPLNPKIWNPVGWSVQTEMGFYFLFPFLLKFHRRITDKRGWKGWLQLMAFYTGLGWAVTLIVATVSPGFDPTSSRVYRLPWLRFTEFAIGMLFGTLHKAMMAMAATRDSASPQLSTLETEVEDTSRVSDADMAIPLPPWVVQFSHFAQTNCDVIFLATVAIVVGMGVSDTASDWCAFGIFALLLGVNVYALASNEASTLPASKMIVQFLSTRVMRNMGEISYCFYLIHFSWPALLLWMKYHLPPMGDSSDIKDPFDHINPHLAWPFFLISVGAAAMLHELVETPVYLLATSWLKSKDINCDCCRTNFQFFRHQQLALVHPVIHPSSPTAVNTRESRILVSKESFSAKEDQELAVPLRAEQ